MNQSKTPVISFQDVSFAYKGAERDVLCGVSFDIFAGDFALIKGPSGAGKSTLLRLVARFEAPRSGVIRYKGAPISNLPPTQLRREAAFLHQAPVVEAGTVRGNLLAPFSLKSNKTLRPPTDEELKKGLAEVLLESVSLDAVALTLSIGQRQRLCLMRALLLKPEALLLDEPTSALDPESREMVEQVIERLNRDKGLTILMVCHNEYAPSGGRLLDVRDGGAACLMQQTEQEAGDE